MDLFDLAAKIKLDSSGFNSGIDEATKKGSSFGDKLKGVGKVVATGIAATTAAIGAVSAALVKGAADVASYGDNIDKMSQKMGMSAESYQEWDAVMQHSGTSMETMKASMKTLANAAQTGNDAFAKLGITQEQIASMSQEELFGATIEGLQNVTDVTERTYLSGQLLGRGATELGALLNTSAEDTQAMKDRVHELGGVMSNEAVKAAARYQDSLQDMKTSFAGLKNNLMSSFLPSMATVMDGLGSLMAGEGGAGETLTNGINDFISNLSEVVPKAAEVGGKILVALTSAITQNLPQIFTKSADILIQLVNGIISALPDLMGAGVEIMKTLATSITDSLPELVPAAIDCIIEIVNTLTNPDTLMLLIDVALTLVVTLAEAIVDNIPELTEAAFQAVVNIASAIIQKLPDIAVAAVKLVKSLINGIVSQWSFIIQKGREITEKIAEGIKSRVSKIISSGKELVNKFADGVKSVVSSLAGVGRRIVEGVWQGIQNAAGWFASKVRNFFSNIVSAAKNALGIHSPSKVFAEIGKFMALGLGEGWDKSFSAVSNDINGSMDFGGTADIKAGRSTGEGLAAGLQPITIVVQSVLDGRVIGESAYKYSYDKRRAYGI